LDGSDGGLAFVKDMQETFALTGAALRIIHPSQYEVGMKAWRNLERNVEVLTADGFSELTRKAVDAWASPFTVAQVIGNRESPLHCDTKGLPCWYDCLLTFGEHERLHLGVPGIGSKFVYKPGTAVFILSNVLEHEVPKVEGDRGCIANFMRPEVVSYLLGGANHEDRVPTVNEVRMAIGVERLRVIKGMKDAAAK
jgi:hypothetical protein